MLQCLWPPNLAGWLFTLRFPKYKVTWILIHVVLQDHVANQKYCTSTTLMPIATKPDRILTYRE